MTATTDPARQLALLLKSLDAPTLPDMSIYSDPLAVLVQSILMWEATSDLARVAHDRLLEHVIDYNDLRVSLPHELASYIGEEFPLALERSQQLRSVLNAIFNREHGVNLEGLRDQGKREIRKYIESLRGISPYAAARVMMLCYETHAIPVDDQLRRLLVAEGVAEENVSIDDLASWLARQIKASDGVSAHLALQAWVDAQFAADASSTSKRGKSSTRRSSRSSGSGSRGRRAATARQTKKG